MNGLELFLNRRFGRAVAVVATVTLVAAVFVLVGGRRVEARVVVHTRAGEVSAPVQGAAVLDLPFTAEHAAVHWAGNPSAVVSVAFSGDGSNFGPAVDVSRDEVGEQRENGETYGAILRAGGAKAARVQTDRPIGRVTVLALADGTETTVPRTVEDSVAGASVPRPGIIARSGWGADESLRFANGKEVWPPTFWPMQKLLVHHTATQNADPNPASTVRAIYYYHAITQGWGDIGYNFLIDEAGHVYKGRHSHTTSNPSSASPSPDDTITGEDASGNGVTAGHALGYNSGTMGVAFLGTLTSQDATPAAKNALADLLAWKADTHGIDPQGSSLYTNPVDGTQRTFPNIAGHRDVNATECPGRTFYATLPTLRSAVASRISASTTTTTSSTTTTSTTTTTTTTTTAPAADTTPPSTPGTLAATSGKRKITLTWGASTDAGGSGLAGYEIYRGDSSGGPFTIMTTTTATRYNNGGLSSNRAYSYYVKAYDKAGNRSAPSNTATATTG
jgi:N-acetylmuramoyl-L-alanine amidase/Fibronectin type III domain